MRPTVLIATTSRWFPTARLGVALSNAGCKVEAVCPSRHPIRATSAGQTIRRYRALEPLASFAEAISATNPDFIIPGDDLAVQHLHQIYYREESRGKSGAAICALIERSLGAPESFPVVGPRAAFIEVASQEAVRAPVTEAVASLEDLRESVSRIGFPVVIKSDGTSAGSGVRIARTMDEAERAFRTLQAPPLFARAVKRALIDHDARLIWPTLLRKRSMVNIQAFVPGKEATSTVACWQGTVLASVHCEVLNKVSSTGPSTVLRLIDNPEMLTAAERIVRRLKLTGIHGFDFMLEMETGKPHLVEINPRATQVGHLALGPGHDLPAALFAAISGTSPREASAVTDKDIVTLFPHEWLRDPESPFLKSSYHDVPWEEPEFVRLCVGTRRKRDRLYSQRGWARALSPVPHQ
jgi:hypothetical protein